ncbi:hypothetical protein OGAPHI_004304 [Ogataea philodendri]|uniref:glycine dehydrogenase (aminomethyl-transferring) n=2 Tax=Saccharomycotina TaxID=147537 RepID=A0A9P8P6U8_9ASCO|nr:uncharacterized protein OGAPHI_004304 [Ogataea philodendri]KAH3666115.1 hypothetical protein OGAPHI_004304 [Ogataea philodendri]
MDNPFSKLSKRSSIAVERPSFQRPAKSSSHDSRFPVFGLDWACNANSDIAKIAVSSFREDLTNRLKIINGTPNYLDTDTGIKSLDAYNFQSVAEITVNYPVTRLQWDPSMSLYPNTTRLATSSECLRVYELAEPDTNQSYSHSPRLVEKLTLTNSKNKNFNQLPPLTSFDWNKTDPRYIITSSIDSTCTLWDISRGSGVAKTQLIAHDSEVFDVKFLHGNKHVFTSCSNDGSVRVFDLRSLEHSTIIYEPQSSKSSITSYGMNDTRRDSQAGVVQPTPLLRLATSNYNANQLAAIEAGTNRILVLDLRYPETPVQMLQTHAGAVNSIAWHPSKNVLASGADDCQVLIHDLADTTQTNESLLPKYAFFDELEINNVCWNPQGTWIAANSGRRTQSIKLTGVSSKAYNEGYAPSNKGLADLDTFARRHFGPNPKDVDRMLQTVQSNDLGEFISKVIPENVLVARPLKIEPAQGYSETQMLNRLKKIASKNKLVKTYIGKGYYNTVLPAVIQRNLLENPGWYTSYTPYQPEVSQGRLESLLNYQTIVSDLAGLPVANASLLDEGTAAAEAMILSYNQLRGKKAKYFVDVKTHEQTIAVLKSRSYTLGIELIIDDLSKLESVAGEICGVLISYPQTDGAIPSPESLASITDIVHSNKGLVAVASDLMALALLRPPSEFGADIVLGSSQRFGVPMGFGGPHAAFFSVTEKLQRKMPGRLVGVTKDRLGNQALRLALQTREQHIKREKATSNICTAQALLANIAANYVVYHGASGLRTIAARIHGLTSLLAQQITENSSHSVINSTFFDTLSVKVDGSADEFVAKALSEYEINIFKVNDGQVQLSLDESVNQEDFAKLVQLFTSKSISVQEIEALPEFPKELLRTDKILTNPVFNTHNSETAMLRYLYKLQQKDVSLASSMIPLGSCTMKLNATTEMIPITWPEFANVHPFVPKDQAEGYLQLITELEADLADITGFAKTTLMPNSGAQGEYTGLTVIRSYLESTGQQHRNIVLIPVSAHGTNPASATMAGLKVVPVKCLSNGNLDLQDLEEKTTKHSSDLAAIMITYPSTYGMFEPTIRKAVELVHSNGGQVYLDGANMNAQVGLTSPGDLGADVCHLNLHKTFAIPHGGGGPGVGPICVAEHLQDFLPKHPLTSTTNVSAKAINAVSAAPFGSASILPISYSYIKMLGAKNLPYASTLAILNANYMMYRLRDHYKIMFLGDESAHEKIEYCAHEFIIDLRPFKEFGIEAIDVAKRLQDYGFHAPTMSFPIPGTLMIEPTESEDLRELDRFVDSMISIRAEIDAVQKGGSKLLLKNAPHSLRDLLEADEKEWTQRGYTREQAGYPLPFLKDFKTWPTVARVDDTYGDINLMCTCPSVEELAEQSSGRRPAPRAAPAHTRQASTMAAPAQNHSYSRPVQTQQQQPGLFSQMASTAAGVAVGSAVGHTIGAGISGMFGSSSQPAEYQQQQVQAAPAQQQYQQQSPACDADARNFTRCLEESNGNFQACDFYLQQLKACQAAASQY